MAHAASVTVGIGCEIERRAREPSEHPGDAAANHQIGTGERGVADGDPGAPVTAASVGITR